MRFVNGLVVACAVLAVSAGASGCKSKKKPPTTSTAGPVAKQSAPGSAIADDDSDDDGDDGDRAAPAKQVSAKADADSSAAMRARLAAETFPDPQSIAKKAPPKVVVKKDPRGGCGEVTVGKSTFKLDCDTEGYGKITKASQQILKEDDLVGGAAPGGAPPAKLPSIVDFREKKLVGPVFHQGNSLTCTAMSLAAVVDHEMIAITGKPTDVSPMNIWARYANPDFNEAIQTNEGKSIAPNDLWPYDWKRADSWDKGKPPPPDILAKIESKAVAKIVDVVDVGFKDIRGTLAQGHAVWFALSAGHYLSETSLIKGTTHHIVPPYDWKTVPASQRMGHALALVGYRTVASGKTYYLIQNSWGPDWGENGFAYIDEDTLLKNFKYGYGVEVAPVTAGGAAAKPSSAVGAAPPTKCKPGLLPDAATGKCAGRCPDGSARNDGACAEAGECTAGEVNVKGRCVRAAPTLQVKKDGFAVKCVPGGCLYGFSKGVAGCKRDKGCVAACAAPTFKLVKTATGIRCN